MSPKIYMVRGIIIGFFVGMLFMLPHVIKWMKFPVIYVDIVPNSVYYQRGERHRLIKDVMSKEEPKPSIAEVVIAPPRTIQQHCRKLLGDDVEGCNNAFGFHYYDKREKKHWIYSVDGTEVLTHEFRHVFEGSYHRAQRDLDHGRLCKQFEEKFNKK